MLSTQRSKRRSRARCARQTQRQDYFPVRRFVVASLCRGVRAQIHSRRQSAVATNALSSQFTMMLKVIIVGAGINGVTSAIELKKRGHKVSLIDPGPLPHPLAASTDISKAIRAAYGADEEYTVLAERSIPIWRKWNQELGVELYHETGVLFLRRRRLEPGDFEYESCKVLEKRGHKFERIGSAKLRERFLGFYAER